MIDLIKFDVTLVFVSLTIGTHILSLQAVTLQIIIFLRMKPNRFLTILIILILFLHKLLTYLFSFILIKICHYRSLKSIILHQLTRIASESRRRAPPPLTPYHRHTIIGVLVGPARIGASGQEEVDC